MPEQSFPIIDFKGLNKSQLPSADPRYTRSLDGMRYRFGKAHALGGTTKFRSISTASATTPIISLMLYPGTDLVVKVLRMTPTKVHVLDTVTPEWDDVTGTDLTGSATTRPQWAMHKGVLVFTNEGEDRPRKYTGTGNTAELGGTPPFAKAICDYMKFLFLWNVSTDGSTFLPRTGYFSDDYDVNWSSCSGFELNLDETPGEVRAALALGNVQLVYKADAIQPVKFEGGSTRFKQDVLPFDQGILAPLSLKLAGNAGHIFLATDYQLYTVSVGGVKPLPPGVTDILQNTMYRENAGFAYAEVQNDLDIYNLLYPMSSADTYKAGRILYNFRTGEFGHRTYEGHEFLALLAFKFEPNEAEHLIASASSLVYELDTTTTNDDGTKVDRYQDTDWQGLGNNYPKFFRGVNLVFKRAPNVRVKVSVAVDYQETFRFEKTYDLKGKHGEQVTIINYEPPKDLEGTFFNVRVRFFHDGTNKGELQGMFIRWEPSSKVKTQLEEAGQNLSLN